MSLPLYHFKGKDNKADLLSQENTLFEAAPLEKRTLTSTHSLESVWGRACDCNKEGLYLFFICSKLWQAVFQKRIFFKLFYFVLFFFY